MSGAETMFWFVVGVAIIGVIIINTMGWDDDD